MAEIDFAQPRHADATFIDVDLVEETMEGLEFSKCEFRSVRFNCAVQTDVAFLNCTFVNCTFFDARFLRGSDLSSLDPAATTLRHAIITAEQAVTLAMAFGLEIRDV